MAITVKEIQEKEFAIQATNGYDMEQVDDFLDALAEQIGAMTRENFSLANQVKTLESALAAAEAAKAEAEAKTPDYNESGYFKNLENAMRESLIGAQRIADETTTEANKKAEQTIADAAAKANAIQDAAQKSVDELNAEIARLKGIVETYRNGFKKLVDDQMAALNASEI